MIYSSYILYILGAAGELAQRYWGDQVKLAAMRPEDTILYADDVTMQALVAQREAEEAESLVEFEIKVLPEPHKWN